MARVARETNASMLTLYFPGAVTAGVEQLWGSLLVVPRESLTAAGVATVELPFYCDVKDLRVYAAGANIERGTPIYWNSNTNRYTNQVSADTAKKVGYARGAFGNESADPIITDGQDAVIQVIINWEDVTTDAARIKIATHADPELLPLECHTSDIFLITEKADHALITPDTHCKMKLVSAYAVLLAVTDSSASTMTAALHRASDDVVMGAEVEFVEGTDGVFAKKTLTVVAGTNDEIETNDGAYIKIDGTSTTLGAVQVFSTWHPVR